MKRIQTTVPTEPRQLGLPPLVQPKVGDTLLLDGETWPLAMCEGKWGHWLYDECGHRYSGEFIAIPEHHILVQDPQRSRPGHPVWITGMPAAKERRSPLRVTTVQTYKVKIGLGAEQLEYDIEAENVDQARRLAIGRLSRNLNVVIPVLITRLKTPPNYIRVELLHPH
jgi:hypothetical protein